MPDIQRSSPAISRRSLLAGASVAPGLGALTAPGVPDLAVQCGEWLTLNLEIDQLSLRWARLEAFVMHQAPSLGMRQPHTPEMHQIDARLRVLSNERDRRLDALSQCPARTLHEVACKLAVAAHRMADEGGPEHDIVADAVRVLAAVVSPPAAP